MSSTTEQIKERLPIADVVGSYIKLDRAGSNWKARCPFHNERTPSFVVSPSRNSYHCFGCNRGGDIFTFVEEIEGVEFKEALVSLAERAGVVLPKLDPRERSRESRAYQLLEDATRFYEANLARNDLAKEYLSGRGLKEAMISEWRLGYAQNDWRLLLAHLNNKGYSDQEIEASGLVVKSDKGTSRFYDRFRGRIMFPIENSQGKIVGFSGRHFVPGVKEEGAKYINSPETPLFQKSRVLYGFSRAKQAMMREDVAVLVEGQMDLLMAHQAGVAHALASSGTALTEEHLKAVKRFTQNLVMAFDGDEAGFAASERAFKMASLSVALGMIVKVAKMPKGEDPADYAGKDPEGFKKTVAEARYIVDFYLASLLERGYDGRELVKRVRESVLPLIALIPSHMDRAHYVSAVAKAVALDEAHIWEELKKIERPAYAAAKEETKEHPSIRKEERIREKIEGILEWQEGELEKKIETPKWRANYDALTKGMEPVLSKKENLILQAEVYYGASENLERDIGELLLLLEQELLERELETAMKELRAAESGKEEESITAALARCHTISKRINEVKGSLKQI